MFDFKNNWYPVLLARKMKPNKSVKVYLFDKAFVLYRDKDGIATCLEDHCPHRGAPLSLGRVKHGELTCAYHNWCFAQKGVCSKIPSLDGGTLPIPKTANATALPCIEKHDVIWIWPGDKDQCHGEIEFDRNEKNSLVYSWDVKAPFDLYLENILDISHVPFVHKNTLNRLFRFNAMEFQLGEKTESGFNVTVDHKKHGKIRFTNIEFVYPNLIHYEFLKHKKKMIALFFIVPYQKNKTRVFHYVYSDFDALIFKISSTRIAKLFSEFILTKVNQEDSRVLIGQDENRQKNISLMNQLTKNDLVALEYRKWLSTTNYEGLWLNCVD